MINKLLQLLIFHAFFFKVKNQADLNHICGIYSINSVLFSDIDECNSDPCQNNGICNNGVNRYTCQCPNGISGSNCQISKS